MQATAVVGAASGSGARSDGGSVRRDGPSNPKKGNLSSSSAYKEAKLTFRDDDWDSLAQDEIADDRDMSSTDQAEPLQPSPPAAAGASLERACPGSREFADSVDCVFLNETYSVPYAESKLRNENVLLNSELASEMQEREELFFDVLEHSKILDLEGSYQISDDDDKETAEEAQKHGGDETSQQEYHSEEEQEYLSSHFSFDRAKTSSVSDLEVVGLMDPGCEGKHAGSPEADRARLERSSGISLGSVDVYGQEDSPHVSKFQNSVALSEHHKPKHEKRREQETSLMRRTVFDEIVLSSSPPENQESRSNSSFLNPQQALKTKIYTGKIKSQVTETKDFCGNITVENKMLQHLENPSMLPRDKASETVPQPYQGSQTSCSLCDDSALSACERSSYMSLPGTPHSAPGSPPPPRTGGTDAQDVEEDGSLEGAAGSAADQASLLGVEGARPDPVTGSLRRALTVNQTADVSSDFRACFTTSRATTARPSVVSTSSNTEITMMNKRRPGECQKGRHRSVACNTDWSYCPGSEDTQVAVMKGPLGKAFSVDSVKPGGNFLNKDSLELRKTLAITELKKHPEREPQLSKDREKNLPSKCCQKIMQRAVKAELQLLNVHYQLCHRHCSEIYRDLSASSVHKELGSALLSVLGDLKVRYVSLKEKINKGVPLEELPPLSVESKLLSAFSAFAARLMKKESHVFSGADSELDNQIICDVDVSSSLKKTLSQVSLLSDNSHPNQSTSPKEDGLKNGDIDGYFSQLKLDDKDCRNQDVSEDWFDARESLAGADCSGDSRTEQARRGLECAPEIKNVDPLHREKSYLVHVGGLCPSVSEADLRYHFQKYQLSEISMYDSSNYRYASLAFKRNNDAKSAVNEMNGMEINGKPVNVRLVKSPGEYVSPLSSKNGRRVSLNNLEKSINKEISSASCISRLPRTRPRQLGSEEDGESFHFDQGVKKKNCKQIESAKPLPDTPLRFTPPNTLNLRSFTKIMRRLAELHPDVCRDRIIDALQAVRMSHKGFLNGLSINTIVEMTSSVLKNSTSS
ncbi:RNA binding motif protein 44 [Phyllostomus discolor]|uniref:RNA binding motif protein 44 n=1 Tax=Phyllostomus discolor TaxID=89673 RepID=A0A834AQK2_9CHIR|nr:RNA binding motif protein 44 [Phyllostomus discolor]